MKNLPTNFEFTAQYGEDKWIVENWQLPEKGFYVDLGCAHPVRYSNTAFLREMGWDGLAVDGNEAYRQHWIDAGFYVFRSEVIGHPMSVEAGFLIHENSAASRIHPGGNRARTLTLEAILYDEGVGGIDLLSIDLEGWEFEALQGLDFDRHQPRIIISEFKTPEIERPRVIHHDYRVLDYLTQNGYYVAHETEANHIFVRQ